MAQEKVELLKGTLDTLILKIVAAGPLHGYAISQRIQQISRDFFQVPQGSLYPALHRLEEQGWLEAQWKDTSTGREAKFYTLTRKGRKQLETEVSNWERLSDAVALTELRSRGAAHALVLPSSAIGPYRKAPRLRAQFHLERQIADYVASGLPPAKPAAVPSLEFGGLKKECREACSISAAPSPNLALLH